MMLIRPFCLNIQIHAGGITPGFKEMKRNISVGMSQPFHDGTRHPRPARDVRRSREPHCTGNRPSAKNSHTVRCRACRLRLSARLHPGQSPYLQLYDARQRRGHPFTRITKSIPNVFPFIQHMVKSLIRSKPLGVFPFPSRFTST